MFNRFDLRLKTLIDFLQYSLHCYKNLLFAPDSFFSGGENRARYARKRADVGKMWGNFRKEKSLNLLFLEV